MEYTRLFSDCIKIVSFPDLSKWNVTKTTDMSTMFNNCNSLKVPPLIGSWDVKNVITMKGMFRNCFLLPEINIAGWKVHNVEDMSFMFYGCKSIKKLFSLSNWPTMRLLYAHKMFTGCDSLDNKPDIIGQISN